MGVDTDNGIKKYYFNDLDRTPYFYVLVIIFVLSLIYFGRDYRISVTDKNRNFISIILARFIAYTIQPACNIYILSLICFAPASVF